MAQTQYEKATSVLKASNRPDAEKAEAQKILDATFGASQPAPAPAAPAANIDTPKTDRTPAISVLQNAKNKANSIEEMQKRATREANTLAAQMRQARIDAINQTFAPRIEREKAEGAARMSRVAALNFNKGIVGSGVDTTFTEEQRGKNNKVLEGIEQEKALLINDAFNKADELARTQAEKLTGQYKEAAEGNVKMYQDQYNSAVEALTLFGKAGQTFEDLERADPNTIKTLREIGGLSDFQMRSILNQNNPSANAKLEFQDGVVYQYYTDPRTGQVKISAQRAEGIPPNYKPQFAPDGTLLFMPDRFDPSKPFNEQVISGGNFAKPESSDDFGGYTTKQMSAITRINENVSKSETYKKTSNMRSYVDNVTASLSQGTGVGDLAAINQFQKVIDEGAVTRDQDVKLIQQSQSLLNTLRTKVKKLEKGEQLSPELRTQMRHAVEALYAAQTSALEKSPYIIAKKKEAEQYGLSAQDTILGELGIFADGNGEMIVAPDGTEVILTD